MAKFGVIICLAYSWSSCCWTCSALFFLLHLPPPSPSDGPPFHIQWCERDGSFYVLSGTVWLRYPWTHWNQRKFPQTAAKDLSRNWQSFPPITWSATFTHCYRSQGMSLISQGWPFTHSQLLVYLWLYRAPARHCPLQAASWAQCCLQSRSIFADNFTDPPAWGLQYENRALSFFFFNQCSQHHLL